jgi:hypothetical protein
MNTPSAEDFIYRVQDAEGRGPWRPGFSACWVEDRPDHENLQPCFDEFPYVLRKHMAGMAIGCGCRTLHQLRRWITFSEYSKLKGYGYQAVRMQPGRILGESAIQLVFDRAKPLNSEFEPVNLYDP